MKKNKKYSKSLIVVGLICILIAFFSGSLIAFIASPKLKNIIEPKLAFLEKIIPTKEVVFEPTSQQELLLARNKENGQLLAVSEEKFDPSLYVKVDKEEVNNPPSEGSLRVATYISLYVLTSEKQKEEFKAKFAKSDSTFLDSVKNFAYVLDLNPEKLTVLEVVIEKQKADSSRPIINFESPNVIQRPNYPKNCTANSIGSFTYINCY